MSILPARLESTIRIRWQRFLRYGIQISGQRFPARLIFFRWFISLLVLNIISSRFATRPLFGIGQISYTSELNDDMKFWHGRHLIFVASSGRSGSGYLKSVLECGVGVVSKHEPEPKMNEKDLVDVLIEGKRAETLNERRNRKVQAIRNSLIGTQLNVAYAETSHMFIKTFADAILTQFGDNSHMEITILIPHRPVADVVISQLRLGWFSANHSGRGVWYYAIPDLHDSERFANFTTDHSADEHPVSLAIGYNADVALRIRELRELVRRRHSEGRWSGVRLVDVQLNDIAPSNSTNITQFLLSIGLSPLSFKTHLLGVQHENTRDFKKQIADFNIDINAVRDSVTRTWNRLESFHM